MPFEYVFSPFTMLEFELKSSTRDAAQGVGIGADGTIHRAAVFLAREPAAVPPAGQAVTAGSLWAPVHTDGEGWVHYRIPVGQYLRYLRDYGVQPCIALINEVPDGQPAECRFRKVTFREEP